jgi:hypothetical protein
MQIAPALGTRSFSFKACWRNHVVSAVRKSPRAMWIVALHHHLLEHPMPVAFSERHRHGAGERQLVCTEAQAPSPDVRWRCMVTVTSIGSAQARQRIFIFTGLLQGLMAGVACLRLSGSRFPVQRRLVNASW